MATMDELPLDRYWLPGRGVPWVERPHCPNASGCGPCNCVMCRLSHPFWWGSLFPPLRYSTWRYEVHGVSVLRRRVARGPGAEPLGGLNPESPSVKRFPGLSEFLGATVYGDGTDRLQGTISIFVADGKWKGSLNDRDQELSLYVTANDLVKLLDVLEAAVVKEEGDWRSWKKPLPKKR